MSQFLSLILAILGYFLSGKFVPPGAVYSSPVGTIDAATLQFIWAIVAAVIPVLWSAFPQWKTLAIAIANAIYKSAGLVPPVDPTPIPGPTPIPPAESLEEAIKRILDQLLKQRAAEGKP